MLTLLLQLEKFLDHLKCFSIGSLFEEEKINVKKNKIFFFETTSVKTITPDLPYCPRTQNFLDDWMKIKKKKK